MSLPFKKCALALAQIALSNALYLIPATSLAGLCEADVAAPLSSTRDGALQGAEYLSAGEVADRLAQGCFTSVALVQHLNERIRRLDKKMIEERAINAVLELDLEVLSVAQGLDEERRQGKVRGPLHGVPVLLKDNIETADGLQTAAGSPAMIGQPAPRDAFIVARLREAGAIILGKTNMSEWSNFRGDDLPDGWSGRGGQTHNPHKLDGEVCGSSSGSAAAVAAGFAPLSLGTETMGSIICPSSKNGVVGLKPSVGLLSRTGIVPASRELDSAGPITRSVRDAALMLNAMVGLDPQDPATAQVPVAKDYSALLKEDALKGKVIGYPSRFQPGSEGLAEHPRFAGAMAAMRAAGAQLVPVDLQPTDWSEGQMTRVNRLFDMSIKRVLPDYLASRPGLPVLTLQALIDYNENHPAEENHNQDLLKRANALELDEDEYLKLVAELGGEARANIDGLLATHRLDAFLGDPHPWAFLEFASAALAGYPNITVPSGLDAEGMPTWVHFFAGRWSEAELLAIAYGYEQVSANLVHPVLP
ncbi:amidase family protein [Pseudomonas gingeri]|uniref:Amidase n=1 Tax=Pseudomonas gingeri TaxID=117681 RepID=A0A7Y7YHX5_9PSED|nr:amidase family protein [Pseudomonas gingeri]NWA01682.1 amidase [Pseudomonas gingeri]NWA13515.1 amidase [Pseudomonas gingeri]NWA53125.1 amidase [Pseudomonas gingeri]NWA96622.1 amidase [Pseudomonas gingeri]NWA99741.1 amidase [Pseudomonas gingeri]